VISARALQEITTGQLAILQSPGPQQALYLDGARLEECYGILPLQDPSGLSVTILSYRGSLFFAFNADSDIVLDIQRLRDALDTEVSEIQGAAAEQGPRLRAVASGSA
jgi:hypothetical protein